MLLIKNIRKVYRLSGKGTWTKTADIIKIGISLLMIALMDMPTSSKKIANNQIDRFQKIKSDISLSYAFLESIFDIETVKRRQENRDDSVRQHLGFSNPENGISSPVCCLP
jgi:hypothetical protein